MFTLVEAPRGNQPGGTSVSSVNSGTAFDLGANETVAVLVTWEDTDPVTVTLADNRGSNVFSAATRTHVTGPGRGVQWFYVLASAAVPACVLTATFNTATNFPGMHVIRSRAQGTPTYVGESSSASGLGSSSQTLPSLTAGQTYVGGFTPR